MGGSPGNAVENTVEHDARAPAGAAHLSMHLGTKFDPTGKPRWRVLPSGSQRNLKSPVSPLRGLGSSLPYSPVLPHWANSCRPYGAVAWALPSDSSPPTAKIAPSHSIFEAPTPLRREAYAGGNSK